MDEQKNNKVLEIFHTIDDEKALGLDIGIIDNQPYFMTKLTTGEYDITFSCLVDDKYIRFGYFLGEFNESYELYKAINNYNKIGESNIKMVLRNDDKFNDVFIELDVKYNSISEIKDKVILSIICFFEITQGERYKDAFDNVMQFQLDVSNSLSRN